MHFNQNIIIFPNKKTKNAVKSNYKPRTGTPSINSNFARVSVSTYVLVPDPVDSRRLISSSMFFNLILTSKKYILPMTTSFRWYLLIFKF